VLGGGDSMPFSGVFPGLSASIGWLQSLPAPKHCPRLVVELAKTRSATMLRKNKPLSGSSKHVKINTLGIHIFWA